MAKYFIHNDEQELKKGHNLLGTLPSGLTVVDYQNPGEQADVSDAALAIEADTGVGIIGTPSIVVQLNLFNRLYNEDGSKNTTNRTLQWKCIEVILSWSWEDIEDAMADFVTANDADNNVLLAVD